MIKVKVVKVEKDGKKYNNIFLVAPSGFEIPVDVKVFGDLAKEKDKKAYITRKITLINLADEVVDKKE